MNPIAAVGTVADDLRAAVRGIVAAPGDPAYDETRFAHHVNVDQRPAAVVIPSDADDVSAVLRLAGTYGLRVTAQAGGHGATTSMDDCVLIRTHDLRDIDLDTRTGRARVGAGVRWGELHQASAHYGLHGVCGTAPDISVVGYSLGGGISWFARKHGYGANHVTAVELVDGDGVQRRVTPVSDPELFWALRGGGGNFGIVTAIEVQLHRADEIFGGLITWAGAHARDLLRAYRGWVDTVPDELTSHVSVMHVPPLPEVPEALHGQTIVRVGVAYLGDEARARELLRPLFEVAEPMLDETRAGGVADIGDFAQEPPMPLPVQLASELTSDLDEAAIDRLVDLAGPDSGTPLLFVQIRHLGGALARRPAVASVASHVEEPFLVYALGVPMGGPEHAAAIHGALRGFEAAIAPVATGRAPLTLLGDGKTLRDVFSPEDLRRLGAVKRRVDRDGVIVANHRLPGAADRAPE